jgi:hypothetical protein
MTRTTKYWGHAAAAGVLLLAAASSCRHEPKPPGPRALTSGEGVTTDLVEAESEQPGAPPASLRNTAPNTVITSRETPALPKPIDSMSDAELVAYLNTLKYKTGGYNTHSANVPCVHGSTGLPCTGSDSAHVFIQPEAGMNKREWSAIPPDGMIVARIINDAAVDLDAAEFGYPAQRKTWWVVDRASGVLRSRYFVRTYSPTGAAVRYVTLVPRAFTRCVHPDAPAGRPARAKFWTCVESWADTTRLSRAGGGQELIGAATLQSYIHPVSLRSAVPMPSATPQPFTLQSNWVSCGSGCCATM